jgi:hypothetical protein
METIPFDAIANARRPVFDFAQILATIHAPMSKKTRTELEILSHAYAKTPTPENADLLIKTLQDALKAREDSIAELEKGVRTLELFLAEKTNCVEKKP